MCETWKMNEKLKKKIEMYFGSTLNKDKGNNSKYILSDGTKIAIYGRKEVPFFGISHSVKEDVDKILLTVDYDDLHLLIPTEVFDGIDFSTKADKSRIVFSIVFDEDVKDHCLTIKSEDKVSKLEIEDYLIELPFIQ